MAAVTGQAWQLGAALYAVAFIGYSCATVVNYSLLVDVSGSDERDRVSSVGWAIAYLGGGLLLAVVLALSFVIADKSVLARVALCTAGLWWAIVLGGSQALSRSIFSRLIPAGNEAEYLLARVPLRAGVEQAANVVPARL